MSKVILLTGATDGIGLATAYELAKQGHTLLLHGRNEQKLLKVMNDIKANYNAQVESYLADLSKLSEVRSMATAISKQHSKLDVLINNAGIFATANPITATGLDIRFVVNTLAPYVLTTSLLPIMDTSSRVVNLSSAAQAPVNIEALAGNVALSDNAAYAQSKLAITMWTKYLAEQLAGKGPMLVAVNPASFLGSKMVKEAYGVAGNDIGIGVDILCRAALSEEFADASGKYFDNDSGQFTNPHAAALNPENVNAVVNAIAQMV
ncbi:SDR family NAD(P)-dependent oxidoreductase [Thalassotalea sp. M1531]|uniref:SDR family NAD(P)-dependent oxidoreductase n=1 Tax=Thalassotalea algicola TaxID=2716224 RepID=A0A7Y0Q7L5_9GAMM|nr:SDR family NAD(P)-dependent oxidoreductase [Thalassotalea algicola]NMP31160.1 SDR family NAD(P)-dependent oxidoreductase [Thalassotalea algicola]